MEGKLRYHHRQALKTVKLIGADGSALSNKQVMVSQTKHRFLFGCGAFDTVPLANGELQGEEKVVMEDRFEKWQALFNAGTLPFYWGRFERELGKPQTIPLQNAAKWLKSRGVTTKGHPLCCLYRFYWRL